MGKDARQRTGERLWWIVVAVIAAVGIFLGLLGVAVWNSPEDGTDGAAMLAMLSMAMRKSPLVARRKSPLVAK